MSGEWHSTFHLPEKYEMPDGNSYASVHVHGEERLFDFAHGLYYKPGAFTKKHHGIVGLPVMRTIQCCIDSPKWLCNYGTVYTIFTPLPKKRFNHSKIYGYYQQVR